MERKEEFYLLRSNPEVFLDEIKGYAKGHEGDKEHRRGVGDHPDSRQAEQGGAGQRFQGWRDVLWRVFKEQPFQRMHTIHDSVIKNTHFYINVK